MVVGRTVPVSLPGLLSILPIWLIYRELRSEPPRTRTWNLEIKSLCRRSSSGCWKLHNPLKLAESTSSSLPNVSRCCSGLVSKLVSATASLTTSRVREGLQNTLLYLCHRRGATLAATLTLPRKGILSWKSVSSIPSSRKPGGREGIKKGQDSKTLALSS